MNLIHADRPRAICYCHLTFRFLYIPQPSKETHVSIYLLFVKNEPLGEVLLFTVPLHCTIGLDSKFFRTHKNTTENAKMKWIENTKKAFCSSS